MWPGQPPSGCLRCSPTAQEGFEGVVPERRPFPPFASESHLSSYDFGTCYHPPEIQHSDATFEITPLELAAWLERDDRPFLLDVREANEWEIGHLPGALRISVNELAGRLNELDSAREMVVYCRSGVRSGRAVDLLKQSGFRRVKNLVGGILRWSDDVDPRIPKY